MTRKQKTVSKILELKEFKKEQLQSEVGKAQERLNHEQAIVDDLEATYKQTNADFMIKQMSRTIPVCEVDLCYTYLKHLNAKIEQQKRIVATSAAELEKIRTAMVEAYKEQHLIALLHDKIVQEQNKEADHCEQRESDYNFLSRKTEA